MNNENYFLRFAITPNCNFRCSYCNPDGKKEAKDILDDSEILQIMKAGKNAGITRVHWTGGEPTLRNMEYIIRETKNLGYDDQVITTNGSRGGDYVQKISDAGLDRMIISLDTVDRQKFYEITKNDCIDKVIGCIKTSVEVIAQPTKMNIVYLKDTPNEIPALIQLSREINAIPNKKGSLVIKFIEMTEMNPVFFSDKGKDAYDKNHTGKDIMMQELGKYGTLIPVNVTGNNPSSRYYEIPELGIIAGMLNIPSQKYICGGQGCKKIRLNPYGKMAVCINQEPIDIRGRSEDEQTQIMKDLIEYRGMIDKFYPKRQHKQTDNYGYWRFGNCGNEVKK